MVLYSASLMDLATPAQKLLVEQSEKKSGEKKEKKPRTEKQLLADEKRRQAALAKKSGVMEAQQKQIEEAEKLVQLEELKNEKKRLAAEKRKAKKLEKKEIVAPLLEPINLKEKVKKRKGKEVELEQAVDEAVDSLSVDDTVVEKEKVVKKRRVKKNSDEPPVWFQKYIQGVKGEINTVAEKPKETVQIEKESVKEAKKAWNNGLTRARVNNEVEGHMDRMYEMMFGNKLK